MSTLLSKLFRENPAGASSNDVGSMESLCASINELLREKPQAVGERAAEIVRKNKELFEKKSSDVEAFLLNCSPNVGSAAMVAAIKGMFDVSASKNNESGTDRAVELLNHYVDANNFVGDHLKLVPEIIFPLLRDIGIYCLEKKDKPEIGQRIILKALNSMFPRDRNSPKVLTSAHSVLFACALKTKNYADVEPFIDPYVDEVANEKGVHEEGEDSAQGMNFMSRFGKFFQKGQLSQMNMTAPTPFMKPKFVLDYLYNGACVLIELKRYEDALMLLEIGVSIPAFSLQDQHVDGYKKFILISLLLYGGVEDILERQSIRNMKGKFSDYKQLAEVHFVRSKNTHSRVEEIIQGSKDKLKKDGNFLLAKLVVLEMKKKSIMSLVKMFSSIRIQEISELAFLKNQQQTTEIIDELVKENRITVRVEGDMVFWSEVKSVPSKIEIERKIKLVDQLNRVLTNKNTSVANGSGRLRPTVLYNDDEGLSMNPIDQ